MNSPESEPRVSRRTFLKGSAAAACLCVARRQAVALGAVATVEVSEGKLEIKLGAEGVVKQGETVEGMLA